MIAVVDYGLGNVGSIRSMFRKCGADVIVTAEEAELRAADKLVLPGVGSFDEGRRLLDASGLVPVLTAECMEKQKPLLGICLGMQLLGTTSEEGSLNGLGWLPMRTMRLRPEAGDETRVPHMGWSTIEATREAPLLWGLGHDPRFYFLHSYRVECEREADVVATSRYGITFPSAIQHGNIHGVQFHPEKSLAFGMRLMRNFAEHA